MSILLNIEASEFKLIVCDSEAFSFNVFHKTNDFRYTFGLCIIESRCITE